MVSEVEEREIEEAARWHARVNGFKSDVARVLAYKHAGFVDAWIARHLETTENTVENYLKRAIAAYGPEVAMIQEPGYQVDFDPVTAEEIADWPEHYQQQWRDAGDTHPSTVPRPLRDRFDAG